MAHALGRFPRRERNTSTRDDKSRYETHVHPLIGDKAMALVTRSDVEGIVEALDAKVRSDSLSWHTAWNVWAVVSRTWHDRGLRAPGRGGALGVWRRFPAARDARRDREGH
jgi:hypothetical protein